MQTTIIEAFSRLPAMKSFLLRDLAGDERTPPAAQFGLFQGIADDLLVMWRSGSREQRVHVLESLGRVQDLGFNRPAEQRSGRCLPEYARLAASLVENEILSDEAQAAERLLDGQPIPGANQYGQWLQRLIASHTVAHHGFYERFLRNQASRSAFQYLLVQESTLDPRFDDIIALMQIGAGPGAKLEYARNYWDEMGCGNPAEIHSQLFSRSLESAGVSALSTRPAVCYEAKLTGVMSSALALKADWYAEAMGYFGVTEYLVPRRMKSFVEGWRRLGLPEDGADYQRLHIRIDAQHAAGWIQNVIVPSVRQHPESGRSIAIGALMRLESSQRYLDEVSLLTLAQHEDATTSEVHS